MMMFPELCTLLRTLGEAWTLFGDTHRDLPSMIATRTGQVFKLNDKKRLQFEGCRFRGYENEDGTPKDPFSNKAFHIAFEEYTSRNTQRVSRQKERKLRKQKKLAMKAAKKKEKE